MYVAAYLCNQKKECSVNGFCNNGCMHTKTEFFAKNPENVELLEDDHLSRTPVSQNRGRWNDKRT